MAIVLSINSTGLVMIDALRRCYEIRYGKRFDPLYVKIRKGSVVTNGRYKYSVETRTHDEGLIVMECYMGHETPIGGMDRLMLAEIHVGDDQEWMHVQGRYHRDELSIRSDEIGYVSGTGMHDRKLSSF